MNFGRDYILTKPFDRRLLPFVPAAVLYAAQASGVARKPIADLRRYSTRLRRYVADTDEALKAFIASGAAI